MALSYLCGLLQAPMKPWDKLQQLQRLFNVWQTPHSFAVQSLISLIWYWLACMMGCMGRGTVEPCTLNICCFCPRDPPRGHYRPHTQLGQHTRSQNLVRWISVLVKMKCQSTGVNSTCATRGAYLQHQVIGISPLFSTLPNCVWNRVKNEVTWTNVIYTLHWDY